MAARGPIREDAKVDAGTKLLGWQMTLIHKAAEKKRISTAAWIRDAMFTALERELGAPIKTFDPEIRPAMLAAKASVPVVLTDAERALVLALRSTGHAPADEAKPIRRR